MCVYIYGRIHHVLLNHFPDMKPALLYYKCRNPDICEQSRIIHNKALISFTRTHWPASAHKWRNCTLVGHEP